MLTYHVPKKSETNAKVFSDLLILGNFMLNQTMDEIRGHPVLGHLGPSPLVCFGTTGRGFIPYVTGETGGRAWPRVP